MRVSLSIRRARPAVLAAAAIAMSVTALAQQDSPVPEVRIQASGVIKKQVEKTNVGVAIETAEITMRVSYKDLSLDTNSGQALLRDRVTDAARDACLRLSSSYAPGTSGTGDAECINNAIKGAKPQVDAAIAAANAHKAGSR